MRYYIIAGEASGDLHGGNLIHEIMNIDADAVIQGFGEKIEYDAKTETAILIGNAQMNQLAGTKLSDDIHADKIHYDGITEKYHAISSEAVKSMLSPRRKDNQGNTQR